MGKRSQTFIASGAASANSPIQGRCFAVYMPSTFLYIWYSPSNVKAAPWVFSKLGLPRLVSFESDTLPPYTGPTERRERGGEGVGFLFVNLSSFVNYFCISTGMAVGNRPSGRRKWGVYRVTLIGRGARSLFSASENYAKRGQELYPSRARTLPNFIYMWERKKRGPRYLPVGECSCVNSGLCTVNRGRIQFCQRLSPFRQLTCYC